MTGEIPKNDSINSIFSDDGDASWHAGSNNYNPLPHVLPEGDNAAPLEVMGSSASDKLVIVMVGLPATGKTHIAKRICRFLSFFHDIPSQIFNVGDYRRQLCGAQQPASFYNPENADGVAQRKVACDAALADLMEYMSEDGVRVAALDATNSTKERRKHITATLKKEKNNIKTIFVESICDDEGILLSNIHKVKLSTPDYKGVEESEAVEDFMARRANYEKYYETVEEDDGPFCKIVNSHRYVVHNIRGYLSLKVVHFVMNLHTMPRTFYLTRHGQSEYNLLGKIGGDSGLTPAGLEYARRLSIFAKEEIARPRPEDHMHNGEAKSGDELNGENSERPCRLWTSTLRRTRETAQFLKHSTFNHTFDNGDHLEWVQFRPKPRRNLDELYAGTCDGMTYKEIEEVFPEEFSRRQADKLSYRYPRGESYMDVTLRLEPLAQEMERIREPLLIVGHQGILRILYAYFMGLDRKEAPYVSIPLNNVIELTPHAYGCHEKRYCLMMKEEMLADGQDEPVTSMPVSDKELSPHAPENGSYDTVQKKWTVPKAELLRKNRSVQEIDAKYEEDDAIMNAPSC
mmetsp:Transcript_15679/g.43420  ORF Transcript_15679/g.43420 Transcript_15679/m.43420 type:complete len:573 (-) Transcript_15679:167-1885(-)|eukprot:CAMPEP_0172361414 /NCGR_PEP_ID=MMETSP1060-20121228/5248_1 /TAXON_ID=37318 /ORGANISM="Pseudo-nitzschia pungens, Strain cf. cingulata" /LENGTH=572 /DNA_ID=CAMNT_0013083661 /DNA_START=137 /DNA_END=1855 /DNA_ORIENTATION=-